MPTEKPRVMLTLDPEFHQLLKQVGETTDISVAGIIGRLLAAHTHELAEYHEWLHKKKDARMRMLGNNLLQSYGPDNLISGIRGIDPTHEFLSEQFERGVKNSKRTKRTKSK